MFEGVVKLTEADIPKPVSIVIGAIHEHAAKHIAEGGQHPPLLIVADRDGPRVVMTDEAVLKKPVVVLDVAKVAMEKGGFIVTAGVVEAWAREVQTDSKEGLNELASVVENGVRDGATNPVECLLMHTYFAESCYISSAKITGTVEAGDRKLHPFETILAGVGGVEFATGEEARQKGAEEVRKRMPGYVEGNETKN